MMKVVTTISLIVFSVGSLAADNIKSLALYYNEVEEGAGAQHMRYLINDQFLRIDNNHADSDFILFNINKKIIYSINHEDQTILKIENNKWTRPEFDFSVTNQQTILQGAPKVQNKPVYSLQIAAAGKVCTEVLFIKDTYPDEMNVMYQYQQVLSGQQVATLKHTPEELRTPCFLLDQVYHTGEYYKAGLPVQITYSRGYAKLLMDFKEIKADKNLFKLPAKYKEYKAF